MSRIYLVTLVASSASEKATCMAWYAVTFSQLPRASQETEMRAKAEIFGDNRPETRQDPLQWDFPPGNNDRWPSMAASHTEMT